MDRGLLVPLAKVYSVTASYDPSNVTSPPRTPCRPGGWRTSRTTTRQCHLRSDGVSNFLSRLIPHYSSHKCRTLGPLVFFHRPRFPYIDSRMCVLVGVIYITCVDLNSISCECSASPYIIPWTYDAPMSCRAPSLFAAGRKMNGKSAPDTSITLSPSFSSLGPIPKYPRNVRNIRLSLYTASMAVSSVVSTLSRSTAVLRIRIKVSGTEAAFNVAPWRWELCTSRLLLLLLSLVCGRLSGSEPIY